MSNKKFTARHGFDAGHNTIINVANPENLTDAVNKQTTDLIQSLANNAYNKTNLAIILGDTNLYLGASNNTISGLSLLSANTLNVNTILVGSNNNIQNLNADLLDNQHGSYYSNLANTGISIAQEAFNKANSTITLGTTSVFLGGSNTNLSGLNLSNTTIGETFQANGSFTNLNANGIVIIKSTRNANNALIGNELILNGNFLDNANNWTLGQNWECVANSMILTLNANTEGNLVQTIPGIVTGTRYLISWMQNNSTVNNGSITPRIGSATGIAISNVQTGTYLQTQIITAVNTGNIALTIIPTDTSNTGTITLSQISVKSITPINPTEIFKDTNNNVITETIFTNVNNYNLFNGIQSGSTITSGSYNVGQGSFSLYYNTTGSYNVGQGHQALNNNTTGTYNIGQGYRSLFNNTTGSYNIGQGNLTLYYNTTGSYNIGQGHQVLYNNTTGTYNVGQGSSSLYYNTTGSYNVGQGALSLYNNTTGSSNIGQGYRSLFNNTTGSYNIGQGYQALNNNTTGTYNIGQGYQVLFNNTTGTYNIGQGYQALINNTTGSYNIGQGYQALYNNTTGTYNIGQGFQALNNNTTGSYNIGIGYRSGYSDTSTNALTTGTFCTFIGARTAFTSNVQYNYATVIGADAQVSSNNTITLGRTTDTTVIGATGTDGSTAKLQVTGIGKFTTGLTVGTTEIANTATSGFAWTPSCSGPPTGNPTAPYSNATTTITDYTNGILYYRVGSTWKSALPTSGGTLTGVLNANTVNISGSLSRKFDNISSNIILNEYHNVVSASTGNIIITLPTAIGITGRCYIIDNAANTNITANTTSNQTINGSTIQTIPPNSAMEVISNGSNWRII